MNNNFLDNVKIMETARKFIGLYQYREVEIKNVEGIFLENRSAKYPLIRISSLKFENIEDFNKDLNIIKKVVNEFSNISNLTNPKCLCIYFDGEVETKIDDIYSVVIKDNTDLENNEIINSNYPLIVENLNLNSFQNLFENQILLNKDEDTNSQGNSEKKVTDLFATTDTLKNIKFAKYFSLIFLIVNLVALFLFSNINYNYAFSFYKPFLTIFNQYYRIFTSIFLNNDIILIFIIVFMIIRYTPFIELKLGSKKTTIVFLIGLAFQIASMMFFPSINPMQGSFPLIIILTAAYVGVSLLPSERSFIVGNLLRLFSLAFLIIYFILIGQIDYISAFITFVATIGAVFAIGIKTVDINFKKLSALLLVLALIIATNFIPNQTLVKNLKFEQDYLKYIKATDTIRYKNYSSQLNEYYKKIGAITFEK